MNWNRIINIFIAIFLILNVTIFCISQQRETKRYTLSDERITQLRDILQDNGYALYDHLPDYYPMPKVVVELPTIKKDKIIKKLFDDETYETELTTNFEKYMSEEQTLIFYKGKDKGLIGYKGENDAYIPKSFTKSEVTKLGEKFAEDITLSIPKLELTYIKAYEDYYILEFNEVYKGEILFCSYVTMKITKNGIEEAQAIRYAPTEFSGNERQVVPIDQVLYSFMNNVKPKEYELFSIKKIDLGYHLAMYTLGENVRVEAVPYYRIKLDNELVYYVNAYTNELRSLDE